MGEQDTHIGSIGRLKPVARKLAANWKTEK
jgi:hypothetical protein